jgi:Zn-dependent membrane protease YugP
MLFFDPVYLAFLLPGLLLGLYAAIKTQSTFGRYSRVAASSGLTGAEAAERLLRANGVEDVRIETARGFLSDHYDPRTRTLRLSEGVYASSSLSAIGVACHEAGHALQHAARYAPLALRSSLVPVAGLGSQLAPWLAIGGLLLRTPVLFNLAILLFAAAVVFTLVTLPVEWNASARAKRLMVSSGIVSPAEQSRAGAVLNAAFLTYVASTVTAVLTLLYYVSLGRRRS